MNSKKGQLVPYCPEAVIKNKKTGSNFKPIRLGLDPRFLCRVPGLGKFQQRLPFFIIAILLIYLTGCAGINRTVSPEQHISLVHDERLQGTFTEGRESLTYEYISDGERITLVGEVYPSRSINFMKVHLLFLNQQGTIIGGQYIYHSPYRSYRWRQTGFQETAIIPKGTENISFDFYVEYRNRR